MTQGARRGWVRAAGLCVVLCAGSIGCMNTDQDKAPPKIGANAMGKQMGPGLPNTPTLPGQPGTGLATTRTGQPVGGNPYAGFGNGQGNGVQQAGAWNTGAGAGARPGAGAGTGYGPATGTNYGTPGTNPMVPSVNPNASPTGMNGTSNWGSSNTPAVGLSDVGPIPPSRPYDSSGAAVTPPTGPLSPASGGQTHNMGIGVYGDGR